MSEQNKGHVSLPEVHQSVRIPASQAGGGFIKRLIAFGGPAYLVSVGYMDPGNWATDLEGGARFGYELIWVLLMSNLMAVLLQSLSAKLGIVTGRDLAQACREHYTKRVSITLWVLCEIAIAACDLAEVLGTALGINLLFGIPLFYGVIITALDVFILLALQHLGMRKLEAVILTLVAVIGGCFFIEVWLSKPEIGGILSGFTPHLRAESLFVAIGILGATVMPHNLYLHSALVQTRQFDQTPAGKRDAIKYNFFDSVIALNLAFLINLAILVVAAAVFFAHGEVVTEIQQAYRLLTPLLGTSAASLVFGIALLASGQSSTITGTLAGQIVMEGFLQLKLRPSVRRLITRGLAILPAVIVLGYFGEGASYKLLLMSQVVLSMQLSFAVIPLIHFTSDKVIMGEFASKLWVKMLAWLTAAIVIALNLKLLIDQETLALGSANPTLSWVGWIALPVLFALAMFLIYVGILPYLMRMQARRVVSRTDGSGYFRWLLAPRQHSHAQPLAEEQNSFTHIGAALDGGPLDRRVLLRTIAMAKSTAFAPMTEPVNIVLLHVVESAQSKLFGKESRDAKSVEGKRYLQEIEKEIRSMLERDGLFDAIDVRSIIGYGYATKELIRMSNEANLDLLIMGAHGHRGLKDLLFGVTVSPVRHGLNIPVLIVK
jgi:manganese transport protein